MTYRVDIGVDPDESVAKAFQHAHESLLRRYEYLDPNLKKLRELWKQVYGVKIIIHPTTHRWCGAVFNSEQDYVAFMLRWA